MNDTAVNRIVLHKAMAKAILQQCCIKQVNDKK